MLCAQQHIWLAFEILANGSIWLKLLSKLKVSRKQKTKYKPDDMNICAKMFIIFFLYHKIFDARLNKVYTNLMQCIDYHNKKRMSKNYCLCF